MEKLLDTGLVRGIGVSNFNSEQLERLLTNCSVKPVTNQIEIGPSITQKPMIKFCKDRDIVVTGYSPLGRPYASELFPEAPKLAFLDQRVIDIGKKYSKTGAQVVLRYLVGWKNEYESNMANETKFLTESTWCRAHSEVFEQATNEGKY